MKKTYFSLIVLLTISFLFAFSSPLQAGSRESSKSQPSKKASTEVQRTKPVEIEVKSVSPNNLRLEPGGKEVIVTLRGSNLNEVTSAKVLINNRHVREVEIKLGSSSAKSIKVTLKASSNAMVGSNYTLRLIAGKDTIDVSTRLLRLEVTTPKVIKKIPVKTAITKATPKAGVKPVGKPSAKVATDKGRRGPQVAYAILGGMLTVNGSIGTVVVNQGETATVEWTIPPDTGPERLNATGVWLRVNNAPFGMDPNTICDQGMFSDLAPDSTYYAGFPTGSRNLTLTANPPYVPGNSYYVMACAWAPGNPAGAFRDSFTGTVEVQYQEADSVGITLPPIPIEGVSVIPPSESAPTGTPDLTVEDILWQNGKLAFRIRNAGDGATGSYQVKVEYVRTGTVGATALNVREFTAAALGANQERVEVTDIWFDKPHSVTVNADPPGAGNPNGMIAESVETNNTRTELMDLDLKLINLTVHNNNQPDTYITFKVKNKAETTAPDYYVVWRVRDSSNENLVFPTVSGQAPGAARSFTISTEDLPVGDREVRIWVYWGSTENYVSWQGSWGQWTGIQKDKGYHKIPAGGLPDLKITDLQRDDNNSADVRIRFKVKNAGSVTSGPYRIRYRVNYQTIGETSVGASTNLQPGQKSGWWVVQELLPVGNHSSGENRLRIYVDPDYEIAEENEDNNSKVKGYKKRCPDGSWEPC